MSVGLSYLYIRVRRLRFDDVVGPARGRVQVHLEQLDSQPVRPARGRAAGLIRIEYLADLIANGLEVDLRRTVGRPRDRGACRRTDRTQFGTVKLLFIAGGDEVGRKRRRQSCRQGRGRRVQLIIGDARRPTPWARSARPRRRCERRPENLPADTRRFRPVPAVRPDARNANWTKGCSARCSARCGRD